MLPDNIIFSENLRSSLADFFKKKKYSSLAVLVDENTHEHCYPLVSSILPVHNLIKVPSGEEHKTLNTCATIWQEMTNLQMDRHAALVVLGGGVLGDMGGFCAATYKRGIDFVLLPTTLLAQVDASIGGKLGVDFNHFKNHIGVFQLPVLTLLYAGFLKTLPIHELRSGFAEVIKHILISDKSMWNSIKKSPLENQDWRTLIAHSVAFKARVVSEDPKESGLRKILNAGHTIGHAFESYFISKGRRYLHGEAIAVGLIAEGYIAFQKNLLAKDEFHEVMHYIYSIYGKIMIDTNDIDAIASLVLQDKKNKGNKILCVLQEGIGNARWDIEISLDEVKMALTFYQTQM